MHAIGAANNLLAAMLDNHIHQGTGLGIDVRRITWKRCVDMNDRQLRQVVDGLGGRMCGCLLYTSVSPPRHQGDRDGDGAPFAGCRCPG